MSEADNLDQPFEQVFQHGMAIASQLGREVSRMWQQRMDEKGKLAEREARLLQMAYDGEKRTAMAVLMPTENGKWWEQAKPADVVEAYRVASAWKDHDPVAANAEKNIREQAEARFGIDGEGLARFVQEAAVPVLTEAQQRTNDLQEAKAYFGQENPERLKKYEENVLGSDSAKDDIPYHNALISDWRKATGQEDPRHQEQAREAEAQAVLDKAEGNQQSTVATAEYAQADDSKKEAAVAEYSGPTADEEEWYREQFLSSSPEAVESQSEVTDALESSRQHELAGDEATVHAGDAYNSAERQEALAARMREAGAPEKGIEARQFAESQQKYPVSHAAAGQGKSVNKIKTTAPEKTKTPAKQKSR